MAEATTPLLKQYWDLKAQAGDALLLFRMGDFYELFGDDAVEASKLLEITLTSRDKNKENPLPMAGVPYHSIQGYLQRLLRLGKKVAIAEQFEESDPTGKPGKTIVRRAIVRTLTPAIQFDADSPQACYLGTAIETDKKTIDLLLLDPATGDTRFVLGLKEEEALGELSALPIKHWLHWEGSTPQGLSDAAKKRAQMDSGFLAETVSSNFLTEAQVVPLLEKQYGIRSLDTFLPSATALRGLSLLIRYTLRSQQTEVLPHLRLPEPLRNETSMRMGPQTPFHLDLDPDLFKEIDSTRSALGSRQLKRWMLSPLAEVSSISARQAAVREASERDRVRESLRSILQNTYDLERLAGRLTTRLANPRDVLALGITLRIAPALIELLQTVQSPALVDLRDRLAKSEEATRSLAHEISSRLSDAPPLIAREGGIFKTGFNPELDRLIQLADDGARFLLELETRERERTGIATLKVRYNRVFGYYIEVTQAHLKNVPADYQRKQTTVGAERFFTDELKRFEDEVLTAQSKRNQLEGQLFSELLERCLTHVPALMELARSLGELDATLALAELADLPGFAFPTIDESLDLKIEAGRHPLVDRNLPRGQFVPNDLALDSDTARALLITGPNMGGKSTVMRQIALMVILGQMGAPIPARTARWGVVSSLYTRIGAHDAIALGQSTFMVEMTELAHLLHRADERSLIILDEVGRGTSTYDGLSVAWSALEWICQKIRCRTLFATHYHELTKLEQTLPGLVNYHLSVDTSAKKLRFLYKLMAGAAQESFGVYVAEMAGLPKPVISRAWKILEELESHPVESVHADPSAPLPLFDFASQLPKEMPESAQTVAEVSVPAVDPDWLIELRGLRLDDLTPIQALNRLAELQAQARS